LFDPYQLQAVAQRLIKDRLPMEEFPQTQGNLTAASQCLYDLINGGNLLLYPDAAMRRAISQAVAKETPRGWRITKQTSAHKIDLVAALSFACYGCIQGQSTPSFNIWEMLRDGEPPPAANETIEQAREREAEANAMWRQRQLADYVFLMSGHRR
jgi:phage terminase large subunit-like protein